MYSLFITLVFLMLSLEGYAQERTSTLHSHSVDTHTHKPLIQSCTPTTHHTERTCLGLPKLSTHHTKKKKRTSLDRKIKMQDHQINNQKNTTPSSVIYSPRGALNLLGTPLKQCCTSPMTGYERDGFCHTRPRDRGLHVVCAEMTSEFLAFTKAKGNDLSSPAPQYGFPGLKPGDHWCLCAARWLEAHQAGVAPPIDLEASEQSALKLAPISLYQEYDASKRSTISAPPNSSK